MMARCLSIEMESSDAHHLLQTFLRLLLNMAYRFNVMIVSLPDRRLFPSAFEIRAQNCVGLLVKPCISRSD